MENTFEKADEIAQNLKDYVQTRIRLFKLDIAEKISAIIGKWIAITFLAVFLLIGWVFLNVALAFFLAQITESGIYGFLIVGTLNLIIGCLIWLLKDKLIRIPIMNSIIAQLYKNDEE